MSDGQVVYEIRGDDTKLSGDLDAAEGKLSKRGSTWTAIGKGALTAVTAAAGAVVGFGKASITTGMEFDSAMSQIAATNGWTVEQLTASGDALANMTAEEQKAALDAQNAFEALRAKAKQMGSETNFTAKEAAEGLNILAMSGYDAEQSMDMIGDVLHLSAAGAMDMASAAGFVSGAMKGFNDSTKDSAYYADLMAKGATLANTNVSQLGEAMSGGAATAAAYGQTADSMTISLLRLAEQGEVGSAAATALSAAMKNLYTPTDQARAALKELGINAFDPVSGKARDFNTVVNELDAALEGYTDEQKAAYKQTIFGIQGLDAFNKMTVTGIDTQNRWSEALANSAGEAAKQYATMTDNLQGDLDILNSAFEGVKIALSDELTSAVREFVQFGTDGLSRLTEAFNENGLKGALNALGDVLSDALAMTVSYLPDIMSAGMELLGALATGIINNLPAMIDAALETVMTLADGLIAALPELIPTVVKIVLTIVEKLLDNVDELVSAALKLIVALADGLLAALPELIKAVPQIIGALVKALINSIPEIAKAALELMKSLGKAMYNAAPDSLKGVIDAIKNAFKQAWAFVKTVWDVVKPYFQALWTAISGIFKAVAPFFKATFQSAWDSVKTIWNVVSGYFKAIWDSIAAVFAVAKAVLTGDFKGAWDGIKSIVSTWANYFASVWNAIKQHFANVGSYFGNAFKSAYNAIVSAIGGIVSYFSTLKTNILNVFSNIKSLFQNVGSAIVNGIRDGISNGWNALKNYVAEKARSLLDAAKSALGINSPSKAFREEVSGNIIRGLVTGLDDYGDDAVTAAKKITHEMLSAAYVSVRTGVDTSGLYSALDSVSGISASVNATHAPIVIHNELSGNVDVDGFRLGKIMLQNLDDAAAYALPD